MICNIFLSEDMLDVLDHEVLKLLDWIALMELLNCCPGANGFPQSLRSFVSIHNPSTATVCGNHW